MKYRPEIDGLRAVAVIPVIFFHAGFEQFSGGYVGVDIFFVISGYLITTIILSEKEAGTFSLLNFYERRARRILPALFFVMLASLIAACFWLSPPDMKDFSQSLVAVSTFSSNLLFWRETGYWAVASEIKPLLHTWSVAVEEQYYLLFPLFLMMMWRLRRGCMVGSFLVIAGISFAVAQWGSHAYPSAAFFLLPTRAWELAVGASVAFYFLFRKNAFSKLLIHKNVVEALCFVGLAMIAYAIRAFDKATPFPGVYALIPVLGAALIVVFASPQTIVGRLLGTKSLVGIGLVSYSVYLWHFPLFAFSRYISLTEPSAYLLFFLALSSFPLAYLSWKYVERPFRNKNAFDRNAIFKLTAIGSAFFIVVGSLGIFTNGWQGRFDERIYAFMTEEAPSIDCRAEIFRSESICELVGGRKNLTFLIGDSHSSSIAYEMQRKLSEAEIGLIHASASGCPPVQNVYRADLSGSDKLSCYYFNKEMYQYIRGNKDIEYVIMSARWTLSMEGSRFDNEEGGVEISGKRPHLDLVVDGKPEYHAGYKHRASLSERISDSVQDLLDMGKKVILVYPVPEAGWDVPRYVVRYYKKKPNEAFSSHVGSTSYEVFKDRNARSYSSLDSVGDHPNLYRVYPEHILCNKAVIDRCIVQENGHPLYKDNNHLSNFGARLIVDQIVRQIN